MERGEYYKKLGWKKSPFIKSTSLDIPIVGRLDEYDDICESITGWDRIMVITAPIGYGKTTFMNQLVINKPKDIKHVIAFNAYEPPEAIMRRIKAELPFLKRLFFNSDRTTFGEVLQAKLSEDRMLLVFDEAQDYDPELFKWLRILNDRTDNIFMIFLGLQGLEDKVTAETSFRDRKSKSIKLTPFEVEDLEEIVRERINWAGGEGILPFTEDGLKRLCESANHIPRQLLDNGQRVIEECAGKDAGKADATFVENVLGAYNKPKNAEKHVFDADLTEDKNPSESDAIPFSEDEEETTQLASGGDYGFMSDLSPTQQEIVNLLLIHDSLSISELAELMKKDIRSVGSLIRKLRGLNKMEVARKPNVPYPVLVRKGKETRLGRLQYVFSLSDNARRLLGKK
jgi:hypothetical protein